MENQDFNKEIIDYLYGEMSAGERLAFELKMEKDQDLKRECDGLKAIKTHLGNLTDKEVMEPFPVWGRRKVGKKTSNRVVMLRPVIAVAATLLILMVFGYMTDFSVSFNNHGVYLGFAKTETKTEITLNDAQVKALVAEAIEQNNRQIFDKLNNVDSSFEGKFTALQASVTKEIQRSKSNKIDDKDLENFLTELEIRNADLVKTYLQLSANQQQEYFKTVLTQFNNYMQEQRTEDLSMIQNNLLALKETQNIQKQETDQLLANLITTISNKEKN